MNNTLRIAASLDQPELIETLVEKLAGSRNETGTVKLVLPTALAVIKTSSTEAYVSGNVELTYTTINNEQERIRMPFITSLFFTCISLKRDGFRVRWSNSLS